MIGKKIYLRILEREDIPLTQKWINDPEISRAMGYLPTKSLANQERWFDLQTNDQSSYVFAVCLKENEQHIGNVALGRIDNISRNASFSIFIFDGQHRNQGYGTEATILCLEFAFDRLNLHKVYLRTSPTSAAAISMYGKVGFQEEGVQREQNFNNGAYEDKILFGILRSEFKKSNVKNQLLGK